MSGPRIYTEAWERLKTAAREMEEREAENRNDGTHRKATRKHELVMPASRAFVVATLVLSALCILLGILWFDAQSRLIYATRESNELKVQLDLIQERFKNMDKDRERIEDEIAAIRKEEEETRAEAAARERELEMLRTQKEKPSMRPRPSATRSEASAALPQAQSKPSEQPVSAAHVQERPPLPTLERVDRQGVRTYSIR